MSVLLWLAVGIVGVIYLWFTLDIWAQVVERHILYGHRLTFGRTLAAWLLLVPAFPMGAIWMVYNLLDLLIVGLLPWAFKKACHPRC